MAARVDAGERPPAVVVGAGPVGLPLRIAYQDGAGQLGSLPIDFGVLSRRDDGCVASSIVDPHGVWGVKTRSRP
jgi:hypothetical protein